MSKNHPLAALLSDFGTSDQYVAAMKGTMLKACPTLSFVDITHEVQPQNIEQAAYLLWASHHSFPDDTVFCTVVDPGVGTSRDIIIARGGKQTFLAPGNGLLDLVLWTEKVESVVVVNMSSPPVHSMVPPFVSNTFHGRDIFAPLTAYLAMGNDPSVLGTARTVDWLVAPFVDELHPLVEAKILHIDRFGNIVTNIASPDGHAPSGIKGVKLGAVRIVRWVANYESAPANLPCLIAGSSGLVEIVMKRQSAAAVLKGNRRTSLGLLRS